MQDAMQRQAFVSISEYVSLRQGIKDVSEIELLEVACGTGRLHTFLKDNWPTMPTVASDLSPFYLQVQCFCCVDCCTISLLETSHVD
jgi:hypothetical protein